MIPETGSDNDDMKWANTARLTEGWDALLDWLEMLEDVQLAKEAFEHLRAAGGDRQAAGWLRWEEVRETIV